MADLCIWSASPCIFVPAHQSLGATSRLVSDSRVYSHFWPLPLKCALHSWALDALVHFIFFFFFLLKSQLQKFLLACPLFHFFLLSPFQLFLVFYLFFFIWTPDKFFWSQEFTFFLFLYLFGSTGSQLQQVGALIFVEACRIFSYSMKTLSCGLWDLVPC